MTGGGEGEEVVDVVFDGGDHLREAVLVGFYDCGDFVADGGPLIDDGVDGAGWEEEFGDTG